MIKNKSIHSVRTQILVLRRKLPSVEGQQYFALLGKIRKLEQQLKSMVTSANQHEWLAR